MDVKHYVYLVTNNWMKVSGTEQELTVDSKAQVEHNGACNMVTKMRSKLCARPESSPASISAQPVQKSLR